MCVCVGEGGGLVSCVQSRGLGARASSSVVYPVGSFSDTLLVVSILDIVCDCHLWAVLQPWVGY